MLADFHAAARDGQRDDSAPHVFGAWASGTGLAVVYAHPDCWGRVLGLLRAWPPHYMDDDPATNGGGIYTEIMEPPGRAVDDACQDEHGIWWMGDLPDRSTPTVPDASAFGWR
ncbi:hypothetical protein D9R02_10130 [Kocuria rhizophila]|nr:hypothetical protein D9R02_10130 [Kocuria rhizophila]